MRLLWVLIGGTLFGFGLGLSGMARQEVVLSFLHLEDLGLLLVMGSAVAVTAMAFQLGRRLLKHPLVGEFETWRVALRPRTILGAGIFGLGWGLSGICPGSAFASIGLGNLPILIGVAGMFAGSYVQGRFFSDVR